MFLGIPKSKILKFFCFFGLPSLLICSIIWPAETEASNHHKKKTAYHKNHKEKRSLKRRKTPIQEKPVETKPDIPPIPATINPDIINFTALQDYKITPESPLTFDDSSDADSYDFWRKKLNFRINGKDKNVKKHNLLAELIAKAVEQEITATLLKADNNKGPGFFTEFDISSMIILRINLGNYLIISDGIEAYKENEKLFIPFLEFCDNIEFPVDSEGDETNLQGWFITEKQPFFLDLAQGRASLGKKNYELTAEDVRVFEGKLYVSLDLLQKWLPIISVLDEREQLLQLISKKPLPVEEIYERDRRWEKMNEEKEVREKKDYEIEIIKSSYSLATLPLVDLRYKYQVGQTKSNGSDSAGELQTFISGDFLYLNHQIYSSFTDSRITNARITSGRKDADGKLLGPLKATSFSLGDVYTPEFVLTSRNQAGRGLAVSNYPEGFVATDRITIEGVMNAGWDVEIYRNDLLLDFKKVASDGTYEFPNVDLVSGTNIIKLVFYGPYGQRREETRRYLLNADVIKKRGFYYNFAANSQDQDLIAIKNSSANNQNPSNDPKYGSSRRFGEIIYGLTRSTSIAANFASLPIDGSTKQQQQEYRGLSLRTSIFDIFGRYDFVKDVVDHSGANRLSLQTTLANYNFSFERKSYDKEFLSEDHLAAVDPLITRTEAKVNGAFNLSHITLSPLLLSLYYVKSDYDSSNSRKELEGDLSTNIGSRLNLAQFFRKVTDERINDSTRNTILGRTTANLKVVTPMNIRAILSYNLKPKSSLTSSNESLDYNLKSGVILNLNHTYSFPQNTTRSSNSFMLNISKSIKQYILSLGSGYTNGAGTNGYNVNISLFTSFGYDARYGAGIISGTPMTNSAIVSARVFLDKNNNNFYDKGEEVLPDIGISAEGAGIVTTNKNGVAMLTGIPANKTTRIKLDTGTLVDPYWVAKKQSFDLITHAGAIANIDFPISLSGDAEGYVKIKVGNEITEAANVELELVDSEGNISKTTRSASDGYYVFQGVPYGKYKVRTSIDQSIRLGLESNVFYNLEVGENFQSSSGFNFLIEPLKKARKIKSATESSEEVAPDEEDDEEEKSESEINLETKLKNISGEKNDLEKEIEKESNEKEKK